jgi:lipopolysaccharide transport system ATP-binding protein
MSDVVIRVENLCKEYRLGTISHGTLYRDIQSGWAKLRGTEDPNARIGSVNREQLNNTNDRFCALKDVSFDVRQGEIVGIIGRNGAGKSTLLKIISRVTAPTSGTIKIKGRVASLLEVGTGFHPELTGRENIFLNGAILGMHKGEIEQKFDEIVKFAEIDQFIDTPVKRYSSGMYVRLAFAVAAHLEPEILVVDEVLAVGDAQFQKKCMGKMDWISKGEGKTILFVSHNMSMISSLCGTGILLDNGGIRSQGPIEDVITAYLNSNQIGNGEIFFKDRLPGDKKAVLHSARIVGVDGSPTVNVKINEPFYIEMEYELFEDGMHVGPNLHIKDMYGQYVFATGDSKLDFTSSLKTKAKRYVSRCNIPGNLFNAGTFYVGVALTSINPLHVHFFEQDLLFVTIHDPMEGVLTRGEGYSGPMPGPVRPLLEWELINTA